MAFSFQVVQFYSNSFSGCPDDIGYIIISASVVTTKENATLNRMTPANKALVFIFM